MVEATDQEVPLSPLPRPRLLRHALNAACVGVCFFPFFCCAAAIPIGAHEPAWFMKEQHCSPAEAMTIHKELGAKRSFAVHWVRRRRRVAVARLPAAGAANDTLGHCVCCMIFF